MRGCFRSSKVVIEMSDRLLLAGASVPMLGGIALVALLQRPPSTPLSTPSRAQLVPAADAQRSDAEANAWIGVVVAGNTAELAADAAGHVAAVFVQSGAHVAAGEKLLQFDQAESSSAVGIASAELGQRRSELSRAQARAEAAELQLQRLRPSAAWLSKQELEGAVTQAQTADAELHAAQAGVGMGRAQMSQLRMRRDRRTLVAPFEGTVITLDVDPGDSVVAGQVVLRILSDDRKIRFAFPPGELTAQKVAVTLQGTALAVEAEVAALRPEIDPSAELVFATATLPPQLPDAARWIPGAPVHVSCGVAPRLEHR
jgi:multidrug efflux pump subunit AcrA (membrane-fusion protein)